MSGRFSDNPKQHIRVTAPITNAGSDTEPIIGIGAATGAAAGSLSAADKAKLDTLAQMGAWVALPYAANWSDWGAGETAGAYRYDGLGFVVLKGLAKKSVALVAGDTICTLPVGYRPATEWIFVAASQAGYTEIRVNTGGAVYIQAGGSAVFTSLAQVRFDPAY